MHTDKKDNVIKNVGYRINHTFENTSNQTVAMMMHTKDFIEGYQGLLFANILYYKDPIIDDWPLIDGQCHSFVQR